MSYATLRLYFENPVGRLLEQPVGQYVVVQYRSGPRKLPELQAFLTHAGQLLSRQGWHKLLGDQRLMDPFTAEEVQWEPRIGSRVRSGVPVSSTGPCCSPTTSSPGSPLVKC